MFLGEREKQMRDFDVDINILKPRKGRVAKRDIIKGIEGAVREATEKGLIVTDIQVTIKTKPHTVPIISSGDIEWKKKIKT